MRLNWRELAVDAAFVLGVAALAFGLSLIYLPLAPIVVGVFLIVAAVVSR